MKELMSALFKAQGEFDSVVKNAKGYNYKYATLKEIMHAITPALRTNGLMLSQPVEWREGRQFLVTRLYHVPSGETMEMTVLFESGQWQETTAIAGTIPTTLKTTQDSKTEIKGQPLVQTVEDIQDQGSVWTYLRRYSLLSFFGLCPEDDDDGAKRSNKFKKRDEPTPTVKATPKEAVVSRNNGNGNGNGNGEKPAANDPMATWSVPVTPVAPVAPALNMKKVLDPDDKLGDFKAMQYEKQEPDF